MYKKSKGFTLIELLIALAIIGVISAIAIPAYQDYALKARRADAKDALTRLRMAQEKFRVNCKEYADGLDADDGADDIARDLCDTGTPEYVINWDNNLSENMAYTIAIDAADGTSYTLSATVDPNGMQGLDDECWVLRLDNEGTKTAENKGGAVATTACW